MRGNQGRDMYDTVIFGDAMTGKTTRLMNIAAESVANDHRIIYMGRDKELIYMLSRAFVNMKGDHHAKHVILPGACMGDAFDSNGYLKPYISNANVLLFGISTLNYNFLLLRNTLLAHLMDMISQFEKTDKEIIYDVFLDDGIWWIGDRLDILRKGNVHIVLQSLSHLDLIIGNEMADQFVSQFKSFAFFPSSCPRTLRKLSELLPHDAPKEIITSLVRTQTASNSPGRTDMTISADADIPIMGLAAGNMEDAFYWQTEGRAL